MNFQPAMCGDMCLAQLCMTTVRIIENYSILKGKGVKGERATGKWRGAGAQYLVKISGRLAPLSKELVITPLVS